MTEEAHVWVQSARVNSSFLVFPVTVPCAKAKKGNIKKMNNLIKSSCFMSNILRLILTNL